MLTQEWIKREKIWTSQLYSGYTFVEGSHPFPIFFLLLSLLKALAICWAIIPRLLAAFQFLVKSSHFSYVSINECWWVNLPEREDRSHTGMHYGYLLLSRGH